MPILTVIQKGTSKKIKFEGEALLSKLLGDSDMHIEQPCGGRGACKKCTVTVNGKQELACRFTVSADTTVVLPDKADIVSVTGALETGRLTENFCLCLDIGTTTLALALVSLDECQTIKTVTAPNPQRTFGADVISRIGYCAENGIGELQSILIDRLKCMVSELIGAYGIGSVDKMYVSGNTTMLHTFFGVDCSSIGVSPYTPKFLEGQKIDGSSLGFDNISEVESLPNISAFVGSDIVAGLNLVEKPSDKKYSILLDLGTNAEMVLFGEGKYFCATAAAGPCFEGANISCGMSASEGAVYAYYEDGTYFVIGDGKPVGVCATGLIDLITELVKKEVVDESGYMEEDFEIGNSVTLTAGDIREFQLAKSAVMSAMKCLMTRADVDFDKIERLFVAGGFSAKMRVENAAFLGLLPKELEDRFVPVNNSSLLGTIKYACEANDLKALVDKAEFIDIGADSLFSDLFFENMTF